MKKRFKVILFLAIIIAFIFFGLSITGKIVSKTQANEKISEEEMQIIFSEEQKDAEAIPEIRQEKFEDIYAISGITPPEKRPPIVIPPLSERKTRISYIDELKDQQINELIAFPEGLKKEDRTSLVKTSITGEAIKQFNPSYLNAPCNSTFVKTLSPQNLIIYLKQKNINCLDKLLWNYNPDLVQVFNNNNMLQVLNEVEIMSRTYNGITDEGLYNLLYYTRIAHYWEFYYSTTLNFSQQVYLKTDTALGNLSLNPNLFRHTYDSDKILEVWMVTVDTADLFYKYLAYGERIMSDFISENVNSLSYDRMSSLYSSLFATQRMNYNIPIQNITFSNALSNRTINLLRNLSLNQQYLPNHGWIPNNAILALGSIIGNVPRLNTETRFALTDILLFYPYLSEQYLWALYSLDRFNNCIYGYTNLTRLCMTDIRNDLLNLALPNIDYYEDNGIIFRTKLQRNETERLYLAIKDVDQQLFRLTESNTPVENDENKKIIIVIYESPQAYRIYQPFLYGTGTNNGGIYIESWGTLFTYQRRTPQESAYTLEELLRHEYSHFLQGRYLIKGLWGQAPFYANERLTWFEEGSAEFLVGSSTEAGIKTRRILVELAKGYLYSLPIPSVNTILHSTYANSPWMHHYTYSGLFFQFLYETRKDLLLSLVDSVRTDNITRYDSLVANLSADQNLNSQYQTFVNLQMANIPNLSNPFTQFVNSSTLNESNVTRIQNVLTTPYNPSWKCYLSSNSSLPRFTCMDTATGFVGNWSHIMAWEYLNSQINQIIQQAQTLNINNFNELNCRIGDIDFIPQAYGNYPLTQFYCEGPLKQGTYFMNRSAQKIMGEINLLSLSWANTCIDLPNQMVVCNGTVDTQAHQTLNESENEVSEKIIDLQRKLFASNPQYYRNMTVARQGPPFIGTTSGGIWIRQQITATFDLSIG